MFYFQSQPTSDFARHRGSFWQLPTEQMASVAGFFTPHQKIKPCKTNTVCYATISIFYCRIIWLGRNHDQTGRAKYVSIPLIFTQCRSSHETDRGHWDHLQADDLSHTQTITVPRQFVAEAVQGFLIFYSNFAIGEVVEITPSSFVWRKSEIGSAIQKRGFEKITVQMVKEHYSMNYEKGLAT